MLDKTNRRIWVSEYHYVDHSAFSYFLHQNARKYFAEKIIIPAKQKDVDTLKKQGFVLEGTAEGFLNGKTAFFMAAYPDPQRHHSPNLVNKMDNLKKILSSPVKSQSKIPEGYTIRIAKYEDAPALAELFGKVFSTYPTPLNKVDYVLESMNNDVLFYLATYNGKIASTAAAEIDIKNSNAEMTNCATNPEHEGKGLMSNIMKSLEHAVIKEGIKCFYSLSRSSEFGINLILHRMGYTYSGTLINNCHICGDWEDMHLWVKNAP